jgi:hypothetical protein
MAMARRNREINIFNMSLLDILCGALGAFCFMMLAALPYYTPGSIPAQERDKEVQALLNEIDEVIKKQLKNEELGQEPVEKLKRLEAGIKELQTAAASHRRYLDESGGSCRLVFVQFRVQPGVGNSRGGRCTGVPNRYLARRVGGQTAAATRGFRAPPR